MSTSTQHQNTAVSLPATYKSAFFEEEGGKLTLRDVELKLPGPGYLLVKVLACGICHSDLFVQQGHLGDVFPRVPGHETVGDIVAVGEGVARFKVGERVGGAWHGGEIFLFLSLQSANSLLVSPFVNPLLSLSLFFVDWN